MNLFEAFLNQIQNRLTDNKSLSEMFPGAFDNKYFVRYLVILWFVISPLVVWYFELPRYGIWGSIFSQSPLCGYIALALVIISNAIMILTDRYYYSKE